MSGLAPPLTNFRLRHKLTILFLYHTCGITMHLERILLLKRDVRNRREWISHLKGYLRQIPILLPSVASLFPPSFAPSLVSLYVFLSTARKQVLV